MTFSGKWSTLEDVNVKNQVHLHLIFDVNVFQCTLFPRELKKNNRETLKGCKIEKLRMIIRNEMMLVSIKDSEGE